MAKLTMKQRDSLQTVGRWATAWWAVSGLYVLLLVWLAKDHYVAAAGTDNGWKWAFEQLFSDNSLVYALTAGVIIGWVVIAASWLRALRHGKIAFRDGLKDLLFTFR